MTGDGDGFQQNLSKFEVDTHSLSFTNEVGKDLYHDKNLMMKAGAYRKF